MGYYVLGALLNIVLFSLFSLKYHNKNMFSNVPSWDISRVRFIDQNVIPHGTLSEEIRYLYENSFEKVNLNNLIVDSFNHHELW